MTNSQVISIGTLRKCAERYYGRCGEPYEIKIWDLEYHSDFVSLFFVLGLKDDEGTMKECHRKTFHFFIGRRGGVTYPTYKNGKFYAVRFNGLLETVTQDRWR